MSDLLIDQLDPTDYRFVLAEPEEGFSVEKNRAVIKKTIESGMKVAVEMRQAQKKDMEHRIDVLSTYARHTFNGGEKTLRQFVGNKGMAEIYGEKILEKIRVLDSIKKLNRANGNTKFENFYLT